MIREMIHTDGWRLVKEWINQSITSGFENLLTCDIEEIPSKRSRIRTFRSILQKINEYLQTAQRAEIELQALKQRSEMNE